MYELGSVKDWKKTITVLTAPLSYEAFKVYLHIAFTILIPSILPPNPFFLDTPSHNDLHSLHIQKETSVICP